MKKKLVMIAAMIILCLTGCGNKSNSELVDIEQFRCQDDIQTVFDVLGEAEMETNAFGSEHYKYENLNLFGYNGSAYFDVRSDKKTIQEIECYLTLTNKEFEKLLTYFSEKYGSYEVSSYRETTKTYVWRINEKDVENLGYETISIQYNGEKKYAISFYDSMSIKTDEFYFESLKEKESETKEELELLKKDELAIEDDKISLYIYQGDNKLTLTMICFIEDSSNAAYVHLMLSNILSAEEFLKLSPSYIITTDKNRTITFISGIGSVGTYNNESFDVPQWFADEMIESADKTEELEAYWKQIEEFMVNFFE